MCQLTRSDEAKLNMSTTSDFTVQIEKLEGPEDWSKWKWQILMLLHAHCLEDKCPVLPVVAQSQQAKELTEW